MCIRDRTTLLLPDSVLANLVPSLDITILAETMLSLVSQQFLVLMQTSSDVCDNLEAVIYGSDILRVALDGTKGITKCSVTASKITYWREDMTSATPQVVAPSSAPTPGSFDADAFPEH